LPNANDRRPAPVKGPPQENERAAEYALPRKRQENCGRKVKEKPRAATARQVVSEPKIVGEASERRAHSLEWPGIELFCV